MSHWGRKGQLDQYLDAKRDAQPLTVRCGLCSWTFVSTAAVAREQAKQHRTQDHPEIRPKPRSRAVKAPRATSDLPAREAR